VANLLHNIISHFSIGSTDAPYNQLFLVTMLFHVISDLPGNSVKCKWNIYLVNSKSALHLLTFDKTS